MIGVKNRTGQKIEAKFDGREYVFESDEKVTTPLSDDAARHIFGYGERDKTRALLRLGWVSNGANLPAALERLAKVQFLAAEEPKFVEVENGAEMPRGVAERGPNSGSDLSAAELEHGRKTLHKPDKSAAQFAKQ